jgi:hypothetical protein
MSSGHRPPAAFPPQGKFPVPGGGPDRPALVSLEVFGHLHFALDDPAAMFGYTLAEPAGLLGMEYPAPRRPAAAG